MASPAAHPLNTAFLQWVSTQLQDDPAANLATGAADYLAYVDEYKRRSGATGNGSPGQAGTTSQRLLLPSTGPGFVFTLPKDVAGVPGPHDGGGDDDEGGGDGGQQRHHEREFGSAAAEPPAPPGTNPWTQPNNLADKVCARLLEWHSGPGGAARGPASRKPLERALGKCSHPAC